MFALTSITKVSDDIRAMALRSVNALSPSEPAYKAAWSRTLRPIDYMRCAEFEAILRDLEINRQMEILDVGSPQWFSLYLAERYPKTTFHYLNIIDAELVPFEKIAHVLGIANLKYHKGDTRKLQFDADKFDRVVSISVIEHIDPEEDGDLRALNEIKRVLKASGQVLLTVPYKSKRNIVYVDGPVWERAERKKNFFAREYDKEMFEELVERSGFKVKNVWFICEKLGILSLDYYEWGPGKNNWIVKQLLELKRRAEQRVGKSFDEALAKHYLQVSREITTRVVNISAVLVKGR